MNAALRHSCALHSQPEAHTPVYGLAPGMARLILLNMIYQLNRHLLFATIAYMLQPCSARSPVQGPQQRDGGSRPQPRQRRPWAARVLQRHALQHPPGPHKGAADRQQAERESLLHCRAALQGLHHLQACSRAAGHK